MNTNSFPGNPAVLSRLVNSSIAIKTSRHYLLTDLNDVGLIGNIRTNSGGFGLDLSYDGFSGYNEIKTGFAYARKMGENLDLGLQINFNKLSINSYGSASNFSVEAGTIWEITDQFHTGIQIVNPIFGNDDSKQVVQWPTIYSVGFGYDVSPGFFIGTVFEKTPGNPVNIICGFQYRPVRQFFLRMGLSSLAPAAWFGIGFLYKHLEIEITTYYHQHLGISPGLMLLFSFNRKRNE